MTKDNNDQSILRRAWDSASIACGSATNSKIANAAIAFFGASATAAAYTGNVPGLLPSIAAFGTGLLALYTAAVSFSVMDEKKISESQPTVTRNPEGP